MKVFITGGTGIMGRRLIPGSDPDHETVWRLAAEITAEKLKDKAEKGTPAGHGPRPGNPRTARGPWGGSGGRVVRKEIGLI